MLGDSALNNVLIVPPPPLPKTGKGKGWRKEKKGRKVCSLSQSPLLTSVLLPVTTQGSTLWSMVSTKTNYTLSKFILFKAVLSADL